MPAEPEPMNRSVRPSTVRAHPSSDQHREVCEPHHIRWWRSKCKRFHSLQAPRWCRSSTSPTRRHRCRAALCRPRVAARPRGPRARIARLRYRRDRAHHLAADHQPAAIRHRPPPQPHLYRTIINTKLIRSRAHQHGWKCSLKTTATKHSGAVQH